MREATGSFDAFYADYLTAHSHPVNRALHLASKVATVATLGWAAVAASPGALLAAPFVFVLPCWLGHAIEGTRPTSWAQPRASLLGRTITTLRGGGDASPSRAHRCWYSVAADLRMCRDLLRRRG